MKKLLAILMTLLVILSLPVFAMAEEVTTEEVTTEEETIRCTCDNCIPEEESTSEPEEEGPKTTFGFFPKTLAQTLPIMGMGMLGIFLVTCVIILSVLILSKFGGKREE